MQPEQIQDASFYTEIRAGLTTFATMAYIIAVNVSQEQVTQSSLRRLANSFQNKADILSETGGTCNCQKPLNMDGTCVNEVEYIACANG